MNQNSRSEIVSGSLQRVRMSPERERARREMVQTLNRRTFSSVPISLFGLLLLQNVHGAAFINLGFDEPRLENLVVDPEFQIPYGAPRDVIPGWSIQQNGAPIDRVWYYDAGSVPPVTLNATQLGGYVVQYNGRPFGVGSKSTQLSQSGAIPEWAVTLEFLWSGRSIDFGTPLRINGEVVPLREDPERGFDYSANVSRWAGQEVTLSMEMPVGNSGYLDNFRFVVPEPATWVLLGLGAAGLGWAKRREH